MVRAKMKLVRYETSMGSVRSKAANGGELWTQAEVRTLILQPVYADKNPENQAFFAATPSGEIRLNVVNQTVWKDFELDKDYYVDFTPAG